MKTHADGSSGIAGITWDEDAPTMRGRFEDGRQSGGMPHRSEEIAPRGIFIAVHGNVRLY